MVERKIVGSKSRLVFSLIFRFILMLKTTQVPIVPRDDGLSLFNSAQNRRKNSSAIRHQSVASMPSRSQRRLRQPLLRNKEAVQLQSPRCEEHAAPPEEKLPTTPGRFTRQDSLWPFRVKRSAGSTAQSVQYCIALLSG